MKRAQVIKLWKELSGAFEDKEAISKFENKKGYGSKRTLQRYAQANSAFSSDLLDEEVAAKTGWKIQTVKQIHRWWSEEFSVSNNTERIQPEALLPTTNNVTSSINQLCKAPPDSMDVRKLREVGVPSKQAPDLLRDWLSSHEIGNHNLCIHYQELIDNITQNKINFERAQAILKSRLLAEKFEVETAHQDLELAKKYRPWESIHNNDVFFEEWRRLHKPVLDAKEKHLKKIAELLSQLRNEIQDALDEQDLSGQFSAESNPLFDNLLNHCFDVVIALRTLKDIDRKPDLSTTNLSSNKVKEANKKAYTATKKLLKVIDNNLKRKSYSNYGCMACYKIDETDTNT